MRFRFGVIVIIAFTSISSGLAAGGNSSAVVEDLFAAPLPLVTNAPASAKFEVRGYRIEGNTTLLPESFGMLSNYTGKVDFARVRDALGAVQLAYRQRGFATISPTLPPQKLTDGFVRMKIIEGRLARIKVTGNRYFSSENVLHSLPSLQTNILLNSRWFQPELDRANQNLDRQIYPVLSPGFEPGTSDLTLKVKDQFPLHGHFEINDKSTPDTPLLRVDTAIQYDNLWQLNHQVGFDYNFSPQEYKRDNRFQFYDQPEVTSYSAFYRMPLGGESSMRRDYDREPPGFGYDEVSRQFRLLPATGNTELTFYGSRSVSDIPVRYGPVSVIFTNSLANISSESAQTSETINNNLGSRLTLPLDEFAGIRSSLSFGADFKSYEAPSFSTNITYFSLYSLDNFGNQVLVTNQSLRLPSNTRVQLHYIPLTYSWNASRPDNWGTLAFNFSQSVFFSWLASARSDFEQAAAAPGAGGNYTTINAGLAREEGLWGAWSALLNMSGQWASAPLFSNEQFALGGTGGVRGYREGEIYGDDGWRLMFDLRAPPVNIGYLPTRDAEMPAELRCSWFMDYGQALLIDRPGLVDSAYTQWGTGLGFFLTIGEHVNARLTLAWALLNTPMTTEGSAQAYFSVGAQF
jgi:hemolysin activation/secretion protein